MNIEMMTTFRGTPLEDIYRNLPPVNEEFDRENVDIFKEKETFDSSEYRHHCVLCGRETCIDDSVSPRGHKLICLSCVYKYFEGDYSAVFSWNRRTI